MKKTYEIAGMSCGGCVNSVKKALMQLPDVSEAEVQLHPQKAILTMTKSVDVAEVQSQLKKVGHYTIKEVIS